MTATLSLAAPCWILGNTIFKGRLTNPTNIFNQGGGVISDGYNLTNDAGVLNTNGGIGAFKGPAIRLIPIRLLVRCRITAA